MYVIEARELRKSFGVVDVVKGINLQVKRGEIYGFLGRNGAGKSTCINMLTGIVRPSGGTFSLFGCELTTAIKKRIGVMPDYTSFYNELTPMQHLRYFAGITGHKVTTARCKAVLQEVGLQNEANKKVGTFSFGMKKKLGIAQAIVTEPELVFLDEPTSGLDIESAIYIQSLLQRLQQRGMTIFMTSHNLAEVEKICTRLAIMKDGIVTEEGTLEELRQHYAQAIIVTMRVNHVSDDIKRQATAWLSTIGTDVTWEERTLSITVDSNHKIAVIIRALTELHVEIHRVDVQEPSLEDIFMGKAAMTT